MIRQESLREPQQQRSQKRVARILDAARRIIEQKGAAAMKISEVAGAAGVSAGSVYQYFGSKSDIVSALAAAALEDQTREHKRLLQYPPHSVTELTHKLMRMLDSYYDLHTKDPVVKDIWAGLRADKELQSADHDDDLANRDLIFEKSRHLFREDAQEQLKANLLLIVKIGGAAVATATEYEGERAREVYDEAKSVLFVTLEAALFPLAKPHSEVRRLRGPDLAVLPQ